MINDQLLSYLKQQLSLGIGRETITTNLKSQGWTDADVQEAFLAVSSSTATSPTSVPISPVVSGVTLNVIQPQNDFSNTAHPKSKKILIFAIILILLGLVGGGAYIFFNKKSTGLTPDQLNSIDSSMNYILENDLLLQGLPAENKNNVVTPAPSTESTSVNNFVAPVTTATPDVKSVPSNFKTYENSGLKFRYPPDWTIVPDSRSNEDILMLALKTPKVDTKYGALFIMFLKKREVNSTNVVQFEQNSQLQEGYALSGMKQFKLAGMPGSTFIGTKVDSKGDEIKLLEFINGRLVVTFLGASKVHYSYDDTAMIIINSIEIK